MIGFAAKACATLATAGALCAPPDDAGDDAFVYQATQTLLGRRPRGAAEVKVLHDIVVQHDRTTLIDVLTHTNEYVDYWAYVLADVMRIQRSSKLKQSRACINDAHLFPISSIDMEAGSPFLTEAALLADHIRDAAPSDPAPAGLGAWTLKDAIRASIAVDDLHTAFRPYIFALAGKSDMGDVATQENLLETVFGVKAECISCHSSSFSRTEKYPIDVNPDPQVTENIYYNDNLWDRTATLGWALEEAMFTSNHMLQSGGNAAYDTSCASSSCHGSNGGTDPSGYPKRLKRRVPVLSKNEIMNQIDKGGGEMYPVTPSSGTSADLAEYLITELGNMDRTSRFVHDCQFHPSQADHTNTVCDTDPSNPAPCKMPWGMDSAACGFGYYPDWAADCGGGPAGPAWFAGTEYAAPDVAALVDALGVGVDGLPNMSGAEPTDATAGSTLTMPNNRRGAAALMFASNVADSLFEVVSGYRTTLIHGMSRNPDQANLRQDLINALVVTGGGRTVLSLRNLLKTYMLSPLYNRRSPIHSAPVSPPQPGPYQIPMYFNPWAATEDGAENALTGDNRNGQGDLVHRRAPVELAWSLFKDLGWPRPQIYPSATGTSYPTEAFMDRIGRFRSWLEPGTTMWQFDSLLSWEQQVGLCQKPANATQPDFIERVMTGAATFATPPTMRDLLQQVRNRLLLNMNFAAAAVAGGPTEEELVTSMLGIDLTVPYTDPSVGGDAEPMLREYCGAILMSPQYLLESLPTVTQVPPQPPAVACLLDEPCTQSALACEYAGVAKHMDPPIPLACPAGCSKCL